MRRCASFPGCTPAPPPSIRSLLERVGFRGKKHDFYHTLSGGQKQRLAIALALVNRPSLVFFDEPATGPDPQVRREIHALDRVSSVVFRGEIVRRPDLLADMKETKH